MKKILKNKLFLISVFIIMLINLTYAAPICWEAVICEYSGEINSGSIISVSYDDEQAKKEEYCILNSLSTETSTKGLIEIVIHQGQFQGGNSETKRIIVDHDFADRIPIVFKMSKDTSPTTIICNDIIPASEESGAEYKIIKSMNYWSASYDQQWYANNAGMPSWITYFKHYLTLDATPINILTTNNNPETEKQREDNRSATMIGALIIAIIGAIFIYNKNKIIGSFILLIIAIGTLILLPTILWLGFIFIAIAIILIIDAIANNR